MHVCFVNWTAPQSHFACRFFYGPSFRLTKGTVKLHLLLEYDGYLPTYAYISNGKKHDVTISLKVPLSPHWIVAMVRGCYDYRLFAYCTQNQIYFITHPVEGKRRLHYCGTESGSEKPRYLIRSAYPV